MKYNLKDKPRCNVTFKEISENLDNHFEKTGVVIVGMFEELQEQKKRVLQHEVKLNQVVDEIHAESETIVSDLLSRTETAVNSINVVEPLVEKMHNMAIKTDAVLNAVDGTLKKACAELQAANSGFISELSVSYESAKKIIGDASNSMQVQQDSIKSDIDNSIKSLNVSINTVKNDSKNVIKEFSDLHKTETQEVYLKLSNMVSQTAQTLEEQAASYKEEHLSTLKTFFIANESLINTTQKALQTSISGLKIQNDSFNTVLNQLAEHQKTLDSELALLRSESEAHRQRQVEFAKYTRNVLIGFVLSGIVGIVMLIFFRGFSL